MTFKILYFTFHLGRCTNCALFTCSQLRHLNLHNCSIHHPSAFQGFNKLISLELCGVTISSEVLESLISHCPLLEQLVLDITENLRLTVRMKRMIVFYNALNLNISQT